MSIASRCLSVVTALAALLGPSPAWAQRSQSTNVSPGPAPSGRLRMEVPGTIVDLTRDAGGRILYCTAEGEVGRIDPTAGRTVLADAASGPFPDPLRAIVETPTGDVAVLDLHGNIRRLPGGHTPALLVYSDLYMIGDATDMIVDASGNYLIASATPSSGQRAINWVSSSGQRWGYFLVRYQPLQLANDPLSSGIVLSDATAGGRVYTVSQDQYRTTVQLEGALQPGISAFADDGDMAFLADGNFYWIAGSDLYKVNHYSGSATLIRDGFEQLRGVTIAKGSLSPGSWSLYVSDGANPSLVREIKGTGTPANVIPPSQGTVPNRGLPINLFFGFQAFELSVDNSGRLLIGGSFFGSPAFVARIDLSGTPSITTVASSANGLAGTVEGICVDVDDSILTLSRSGVVQRITEGPLSVTTLFSDPSNQIAAGKDMVMDVDGSLYVATREDWDFGKVLRVAGGTATLLTTTEETRGLAANPLGGMYLSQWRRIGFGGTVDLFHFSDNSVQTLPGFSSMNYTNDLGWGDGDICVDANGSIYTISEDDWSLVRYDPAANAFARIGSSYLNHPSGLAIAPSRSGSGSSTGWSLYVLEFDYLWEIPGVPPPASVLVDATLGFQVGRGIAAAPDPRLGKPTVLAPAPGGAGGLIGTATGHVLGFDPLTGRTRPLAGPDEGLRGEIVRLLAAPDGRHVYVLNGDGEAFGIDSSGVRRLALEPERLAPLLARSRVAPQRTLRLRDPRTRVEERYALDGWVVWHVSE